VLSITISIAMIVFVGMMMAKALSKYQPKVAQFQDKKRSSQKPGLPKEGYAGDACDKPWHQQ